MTATRLHRAGAKWFERREVAKRVVEDAAKNEERDAID